MSEILNGVARLRAQERLDVFDKVGYSTHIDRDLRAALATITALEKMLWEVHASYVTGPVPFNDVQAAKIDRLLASIALPKESR